MIIALYWKFGHDPPSCNGAGDRPLPIEAVDVVARIACLDSTAMAGKKSSEQTICMETIMSTAPAASERPGRIWPWLASQETQGFILGTIAALIWGAYLALARSGISAGLTATDIAFLRYGVAGIIMLPWLALNQPARLGGIGIGRSIILCLLVGPPFILFAVGGYNFAPLAHGAVIQPSAATIGGMLLAALVLGEKPSRTAFIGALIVLAGVAVLAGPGLLAGSSLTPLGDAMFASAGFMFGAFTVLAKRWNIGAVPATAAISVLSAVIFVPPYLALTGAERILAADPGMVVAQVLVQGVLSGVASVLAISKAVQLLGPSRAAIFPAITPAAAIILGVPIAGEIPTALQFLGLAIVSFGLLFNVGAMSVMGGRW